MLGHFPGDWSVVFISFFKRSVAPKKLRSLAWILSLEVPSALGFCTFEIRSCLRSPRRGDKGGV